MLDRRADNFLLRHLQFVLPMNGTRGEKDVNARPFDTGEGFPGSDNIVLSAAGQRADGGLAAKLAGDLTDRVKVSRRGDRETGLDDVDTEFDKSFGDAQFFGRRHAASGGLLAVAERGVKDQDFIVGHGGQVSFRAAASTGNVNRGSVGSGWSRGVAGVR
jgi:hypothetical protein